VSAEARLQRLVDEAEIRDLLLAFAHALDDKDWSAYAATFTEDGVFEILGQRRVGRAEIAAGPARDLTRFDRTQHFSTNHVIVLDGDVATARSYLLAVHIPDAEQATQHADIGGTYRCACRRTDEGWRFSHVALEVWWSAGGQFDIQDTPAATTR
jgi:uncharacterized protein (TIGR02246 family)